MLNLEDAIKHAEEVAKVNECECVEYSEVSPLYVSNCKKCAEDHYQLAEWLKELKYARVLLKAAYEIFKQCDDSYYVLNVLEQTTVYDGVECDGYCLMEDIEVFMEEWND